VGREATKPEGDRVSEEPKGLSASGDIIGALSDRVGELTKRVGSLESELDSARKRVAVYEEFDATVRDALSGALRAAHEIRARAENAAQQILEQARDERKILIKEIERLRGNAGTQHMSARNRLRGTVSEVRVEGLLAQVELTVTEPVRVVAVVTRDAIEEQWAYLRARPDLRAAPFYWRMPRAVRVETRPGLP